MTSSEGRFATMTVEEAMAETGMDRADAEEFLAIARGESNGDVGEIDDT